MILWESLWEIWGEFVGILVGNFGELVGIFGQLCREFCGDFVECLRAI